MANRKEHYLVIIGIILMAASILIAVVVKEGFYRAETIWRIEIMAADICWWLVAKEHFKSVEDNIFSFSEDALQKEVFETIPLALAGGMIGRMLL